MGDISDMFKTDSRKQKQAGSAALRAVAEQQLLNIQSRLDLGIGSSGRRFPDYAPSTAAQKGRFRPVTLEKSGQMRAEMSVRRKRLDWYEIFFTTRRSERIARFQHGGTRRATRRDVRAKAGIARRGTRHIHRNTGRFHIPPRPFISPTRKEIEDADRLLGVTIEAAFPGDLRRRIVISYTV